VGNGIDQGSRGGTKGNHGMYVGGKVYTTRSSLRGGGNLDGGGGTVKLGKRKLVIGELNAQGQKGFEGPYTGLIDAASSV